MKTKLKLRKFYISELNSKKMTKVKGGNHDDGTIRSYKPNCPRNGDIITNSINE